MLKKIMRTVSGIAGIVLLVGVVLTTGIDQVQASGTNQISVMSLGVEAASNTLRSESIAGNIAFALVGVGGIYLLNGLVGGGLFSFFLMLMGAGILMNGREVVESIGLTAASF